MKGERGGLLFTDLRKLVCFENTKMAQLVYHFLQKIMGQLIEQSYSLFNKTAF